MRAYAVPLLVRDPSSAIENVRTPKLRRTSRTVSLARPSCHPPELPACGSNPTHTLSLSTLVLCLHIRMAVWVCLVRKEKGARGNLLLQSRITIIPNNIVVGKFSDQTHSGRLNIEDIRVESSGKKGAHLRTQ
jgi:hypothetical protein